MTFNPLDLDIRPDKKRVKRDRHKGRTSKQGRSESPMILGYVERFQRFKPGQSFFIEGAKPGDVEFLRRPILRAGMGITIRAVKADEIYKKPGVRVWRQSGPYDDL